MTCKIIAAFLFAVCLAARTGWEWEQSNYIRGKDEDGVSTWQFISLLAFIFSSVLAVGILSKLVLERRASLYLDAVLAMAGLAGCISASAYGPWVSSVRHWDTTLSSLGTVYFAWLVLHISLRYFPTSTYKLLKGKPRTIDIENPERSSLIINTPGPTSTRYPTVRAQKLSILCLYLPLLFVATTALPNAWGSYTTEGIIENLKNNGSTGRAIAIHLTDTAILKLYPDVMIYYSFLWLAVLFEGNWKVLRFLFLALLVAWVTYWSTYRWKGGEPGLSTGEKVGRTFGQCALLAVALTYLPVGVWSKDLRAHKFLGRTVFLVSFCHLVAFLTTYSLPHDLFMTPYWTRDDFTVPMMFYIWLVSFAAVFLLSLRPVRERFFEVFYASHMVFVHVFTLGVLVHAASAWYFLAPSVLLYFLKKAQLHTVHVDNAHVERIDEGHVAMELTGYSTQALVVKVKCDAVSGLEWHPFSVANPGANDTLLIAKVQGEGSWTQRLHAGCFQSLCVAADPMRHPTGSMFKGYGTVVAVCGGVGVTHGLGVLSVLSAQGCDVHLVWVHGSAELEKYVLRAIPEQAKGKVTAVARYEHPSRESTFDAVTIAVQDALAGKDGTAVMTMCGPASFVEQVTALGNNLGCDTHVEQF